MVDTLTVTVSWTVLATPSTKSNKQCLLMTAVYSVQAVDRYEAYTLFFYLLIFIRYLLLLHKNASIVKYHAYQGFCVHPKFTTTHLHLAEGPPLVGKATPFAPSPWGLPPCTWVPL